MRLLLFGQVERIVSRIEVAVPTRAIRDPPNPHIAKHALQRPLVPRLGARAAHPVCAQHLLDALLAHRAQIDRILQELTQQLAAVSRKPLLELPVREPARLRATKPLLQRAVELISTSERLSAIGWQAAIG